MGRAGPRWAQVGAAGSAVGAPGERGGRSRGVRPPPRGGAGILPARPPPAPCAAPLTGARRRPAASSIRTGQDRAEAGRPRERGAGSPRTLGRPRGGALFIAPGHHVGGVAGDRQATRLLWLPHLPAKYNRGPAAPGKQRGGGGPGAEEARRRKGKCKGRGEGR